MARVLSQDALDRIESACKAYPTRLAAMLPALHVVMDDVGHISPESELDVADILDVPPTRVHEVATFYTMFSTKTQGKHVVKLCRNLACQLRGSHRLIALAKEKLGLELGETTSDGLITLDVDECLASCGTGPMLWCRSRDDKSAKEYIVESLTEEKLIAFLNGLK